MADFRKHLEKFLPAGGDSAEMIRGALGHLAARAAGVGTSFAFFLLMSRKFGAGPAGLYSLALTMLYICSLPALGGMQTSAVRFVAEAAGAGSIAAVRATVRRIMALVLPLSCAVGALLFIASPVLAGPRVFNKPDVLLPLLLMALSLPFFAAQSVYAALFRGLKHVAISSLLQNAIPPAFGFLFLGVMVLQETTGSAVPSFAYGAATAASALAGFLFWHRYARARSGADRAPASLVPGCRRIFAVSQPMLVTAGMVYLLGWTDTFMLGIFRPAEEVGIYRAALKIALSVTLILEALESIGAPKFAMAHSQGKHGELRRMVGFSSALIFWLTLPCCVGAIALAKPLMWLFGREFTAGAGALAVLAAGQLANVSCGLVGGLLQMTGREKALRNAIVFGALCNVALNLLMIPPYGMLGAATATSISTVLWKLAAMLYARKSFGYWTGYFPSLARRKDAPAGC